MVMLGACGDAHDSGVGFKFPDSTNTPTVSETGGAETGTLANDGGEAVYDPAEPCDDPRLLDVVAIQLDDGIMPLDNCTEADFSARVAVAAGGIYGLTVCDCDAKLCDGKDFELTVEVPDPKWLPDLLVGDCAEFHLFTEELSPGSCRYNRIDIAGWKMPLLMYSAGSAGEDLRSDRFEVRPFDARECTDECGAWKDRNVEFSAEAHNVKQHVTLGPGHSGYVGLLQVINWGSYQVPECGNPAADITSWAARRR